MMSITTNAAAQLVKQTSTKSFDSNVTLWEFLLELLLDPNSQNLISWTNYDGEFRLHQSEDVARLWGLRKKRNNMNYDKLSRALRYYYDKNIIQKVAGKKFVYQFVTFPENFSKSQITLPPDEFLKRVNSLTTATAQVATNPSPTLAARLGKPVKENSQLKIETIETCEKPIGKSTSSPKSTTTTTATNLTTTKTGDHHHHVRVADVSRKRARNQYDFVSNQKEQDEIQAQIRLLDMYNDLLMNPMFNANGNTISFQQFVQLTYSIYQQTGENSTSKSPESASDSDFGSLSSSPQTESKSSKATSEPESTEQPLDLSLSKKFKLEPIEF